MTTTQKHAAIVTLRERVPASAFPEPLEPGQRITVRWAGAHELRDALYGVEVPFGLIEPSDMLEVMRSNPAPKNEAAVIIEENFRPHECADALIKAGIAEDKQDAELWRSGYFLAVETVVDTCESFDLVDEPYGYKKLRNVQLIATRGYLWTDFHRDRTGYAPTLQVRGFVCDSLRHGALLCGVPVGKPESPSLNQFVRDEVTLQEWQAGVKRTIAC